MVAGVKATYMTVQLLCRSGIHYVFEMIQYIQSECVKWGYAMKSYCYNIMSKSQQLQIYVIA